jgi:hypothetical protein
MQGKLGLILSVLLVSLVFSNSGLAGSPLGVQNLQGSYSFRLSGTTDIPLVGRSITATGVFYADGNSHITGSMNIAGNCASRLLGSLQFSSGTGYLIYGDGQGQLLVNLPTTPYCGGRLVSFYLNIALGNLDPSTGIAHTVELQTVQELYEPLLLGCFETGCPDVLTSDILLIGVAHFQQLSSSPAVLDSRLIVVLFDRQIGRTPDVEIRDHGGSPNIRS